MGHRTEPYVSNHDGNNNTTTAIRTGDKMKDDVATTLAKFFSGAVLLIIAILINGFVLKYLWGWFMVPLGIVQIGIAHAIGITVIVGYLTQRDSKVNMDGFIERLVSVAIASLLILLIGYIVHSFM